MIFMLLAVLFVGLILHVGILIKRDNQELSLYHKDFKDSNFFKRLDDIISTKLAYFFVINKIPADMQDSIIEATMSYVTKLFVRAYVNWTPANKFYPSFLGMPLRELTAEDRQARREHFINNFPPCIEECLDALLTSNKMKKFINKKLKENT